MVRRGRKISIEAERLFENQKVLGLDHRAAQNKYYWATDLAFQAHEHLIEDHCRKAKVLEIGCSDGTKASLRAGFTSDYVGIDVSDEGVEVANSRNLPNAEFFVVDAHLLPYVSESFDCVITDMLLHHLDLDQALPEIARVLKPGGKLLFFEPLGFNPFFWAYRTFTPKSRTPDERPFTAKDIRMLKKLFHVKASWTGFTSILSAFIQSERFRLTCSKVDRALSATPLRYFFWQWSGVATKL